MCVHIWLCTVEAQKCNDYEYIPVYTTRTLALKKKKKCLCVRAADLEPPAGRGAHVRAGAPFNARCVIARCVILLRRTEARCPCRREERRRDFVRVDVLYMLIHFFLGSIQYISIRISIRRSIIYQVIQVGTQKEGCEG